MPTYNTKTHTLEDLQKYIPGYMPADHSHFTAVPKPHVEGARIYIAGPMRGHDMLNWPAFFAEEARWEAAGWEAVNPAAHDIEAGIHPDVEVLPEQVSDLMAWDLKALASCDAVVLLPGWQDSEGAQIELVEADRLEKPVILAYGEESRESVGGGDV